MKLNLNIENLSENEVTNLSLGKNCTDTKESYNNKVIKLYDIFTDIKIEKTTLGNKVLFYINKNQVGQAYTTQYKKPDDFIYNIEVYPTFRNKGLGTIIIKYMLDKYPIKWLNVAKDNTIAQNLYKKFGFEIVGNVRMENDEIMFQMKRVSNN